MLITHVHPNELLGKRVYDKQGRLMGEVVAITGCHGVVRSVLVRGDDKVTRLPGKQATVLQVLR